MKRATTDNSTQHARPTDRRGIVTGWLLLAIVFLSGFAALGVNIVRLQQVQVQLHAVCSAAALAGAAELMDEGLLYGCPHPADDAWAACEAARQIAGRNRVDGRPVTLHPNARNALNGDVVVGRFDPTAPDDLKFVTVGDDDSAAANTLRVTARANRNPANRVSLWFGHLAGMASADVAAAAQATIDRRVIGFHPETNIAVPVSPLVVDAAGWMARVRSPAETEVNDCYTVDYRRGTVVAGADGVAEIPLILPTLTAAADGASPTAVPVGGLWCAAMALPLQPNMPDVWNVRFRRGLSRDDLSELGGELVVRGGACLVPTDSQPSPDMVYALHDVAGTSRAWPLGAPAAGGAAVFGFAAATVVAVEPIAGPAGNAWCILVQPAVLVCGQAVADVDAEANPWIAKLELTQTP